MITLQTALLPQSSMASVRLLARLGGRATARLASNQRLAFPAPALLTTVRHCSSDSALETRPTVRSVTS